MGCCGDCCVPPKESREPIKYDPDFSGPTHNRSCTDIIWLFIFILYLGAWGFLGYHSIKNGSIEYVLAPIDSRGQRCGVDAGLENKKFLVFFDLTKCLNVGTPIVGCPTPQVCVEKCPTSTAFFKDLTPYNFEQMKNQMVCTSDVNTETMTYSEAKQYINENRCAAYVLKSQPVLFRCIGDLSMLECKNSTTGGSRMTNSDSCVRNSKEAQESLLTRATALDSYVGWTVASAVTFFTTDANERDTHVVVLGRCLSNISEALDYAEDTSHQLTNLTDEEISQQLSDLIKFDQLSSQIVQDLVQSRWYLVGALFVVVLICFVYILLLRWVVAPVVWTSIVGLIGLLGFSLYLCYKNYAYYKANPVTLVKTTNVEGVARSWLSKASTWMGLLIFLAIVVVILLIIVIFLRSRITIAIALIKEGSKAVTAIKSTVIFPIFPWILQCAVIAYGVVVLMYLLSIGESAFKVVNLKNDTTCDCKGLYTQDYVDCSPKNFSAMCSDRSSGYDRPCKTATCHFTGIESPHYVTYLHIANLLGFFWTMFFISGVADMMLASTFSTWYWTFKKSKVPFFVLTSGISRTLGYHLGTVAFGSLIIAIVRVIRVILEYIDQKVKKFDNPVTQCISCCCKCFFYCLENFLKFINKNAYIMCAVHGTSFCTSARDAFSLLMRNILRVVVLDRVMGFIFFLSKLLISIAVGFAVYYLMKWNFVYEITKGEQLHYTYIPAVILSVFTYLICTVFFKVYSMAVDTLFICFLEDCERNDGSPEKPYYMSTNLMKILGKKNKQL